MCIYIPIKKLSLHSLHCSYVQCAYIYLSKKQKISSRYILVCTPSGSVQTHYVLVHNTVPKMLTHLKPGGFPMEISMVTRWFWREIRITRRWTSLDDLNQQGKAENMLDVLMHVHYSIANILKHFHNSLSYIPLQRTWAYCCHLVEESFTLMGAFFDTIKPASTSITYINICNTSFPSI